MVQCMEGCFLADKNCLASFSGPDFKEKALPGQSSIEEIPKRDIEEGLKRATRQCDRRGAYHKGHDSFEILAELNPEKVLAASPHAKRSSIPFWIERSLDEDLLPASEPFGTSLPKA